MPQGFQNMLALNVAARQESQDKFNETIGAGLYSLTNGMLGSRTQAAVNQDKSNYIQNIQNKIKTVAMSGDENKLINILKWAAIQLNGVDKGGFDAVMDMYNKFQTKAASAEDNRTKEIKNYEYGLQNPDFVTQQQGSGSGADDARNKNIEAGKFVTGFGYADTLEQKEQLVQNLLLNGYVETSVYDDAVDSLNEEKKLRQNHKLSIQTDQIKLSDRVAGTSIPAFESTLQAAEALIEKYAGGDIPGIGLGVASMTEAASYAQSVKQALMNVILKARSGAAVTQPEFDRLQQEVAGVKGSYGIITDKDLIKWVKALRAIQDEEIGAIFGGYRAEVKQAYWNQGGFKPIVKPNNTAAVHYNLED